MDNFALRSKIGQVIADFFALHEDEGQCHFDAFGSGIPEELSEKIVEMLSETRFKAEKIEYCDDCGCKRAQYFGGLENHAPDCSNFPL
jgi:hypothetical protein